MFDGGKDDDYDADTEPVYVRNMNKLIPKITISDNTGEVFCCKFSPDGAFLAAGAVDKSAIYQVAATIYILAFLPLVLVCLPSCITLPAFFLIFLRKYDSLIFLL